METVVGVIAVTVAVAALVSAIVLMVAGIDNRREGIVYRQRHVEGFEPKNHWPTTWCYTLNETDIKRHRQKDNSTDNEG
jgi:hypothetical protein